MLLSISLAGLPFAGADMGGFFGNPEEELMIRWYQAGAYQPFMRAHGHLDTKRREPYLFEGDARDNIRSSVEARYTWLSYWYTLFYEASLDGVSPMRALWTEYPEDKGTYEVEGNHFVGSGLLVCPVTEKGATTVACYFPGEQPFYDITSGTRIMPAGAKTVSAPLRKIPVFQRGGTILPRKMRARRASSLMHYDPFTFDIALSNEFSATGTLFLDDYHTYAYQKDSYSYHAMKFEKLSSTTFSFSMKRTILNQFESTEWVERINVIGFPFAPKSITSTAGGELSFNYNTAANTLTIKKPSLSMADFKLTITL